ncbi:hypothetical protein AgCh_029340 [Apium graveolens]
MDQYIIRGASENPSNEPHNNTTNIGESSGKRARIDINMLSNEIGSDHVKRKPINEYEPKMRDDVKRRYVQMEPCKTTSHIFPPTKYIDKQRSFQASWLKNWD